MRTPTLLVAAAALLALAPLSPPSAAPDTIHSLHVTGASLAPLGGATVATWESVILPGERLTGWHADVAPFDLGPAMANCIIRIEAKDQGGHCIASVTVDTPHADPGQSGGPWLDGHAYERRDDAEKTTITWTMTSEDTTIGPGAPCVALGALDGLGGDVRVEVVVVPPAAVVGVEGPGAAQ